MISPTPFPGRAARLGDICRRLTLKQDFPLLKSAVLGTAEFRRLEAAVIAYLRDTLIAAFGDRSITQGADILERHGGALRRLPNVTPNGLVLPKMETAAAYNAVHAAVAEICADFGLGDHAESVHAPINIRLVDGTPNAEIDARPHASAKYHSDMWAGEAASAIMIFLPVLGDTANIGIEWLEPAAFPRHLIGPLADFNDGAAITRGARNYNAAFAAGDILFADPYLIHTTTKKKPGLRLSIDFRFVARAKLIADALAPGCRDANYLRWPEWRDIGAGLKLESTEKIGEFRDLPGKTNGIA